MTVGGVYIENNVLILSYSNPMSFYKIDSEREIPASVRIQILVIHFIIRLCTASPIVVHKYVANNQILFMWK
jgi:hypothetical protein